MILMVPVFLPVIQQVGIDPVHFGVVFVLNVMIGLLTPPFGMLLFPWAMLVILQTAAAALQR